MIKWNYPARHDSAQENNLLGVSCCVRRNPSLANEPTPSAGRRAKCNGGLARGCRAGARRDAASLPASIPPCSSSPCSSSPSCHFSASHGAQLLRAAKEPSFPREKQELLTRRIRLKLVPTCSPTGPRDRSQRGRARRKPQGQKALRRWEISRGRSRCR